MPRGEVDERSIVLKLNRGFANVAATGAALRHGLRKPAIRLSQFGTVKGKRPLARWTGVYQLDCVLRTANDRGQPPRAAEVWVGVISKAVWTDLQAELQPRPVVHPHVQYPAQDPGLGVARVDHSFVTCQRGVPRSFQRGGGDFGQALDDPDWRQSIEIPIPQLVRPAKHELAEGLELESMSPRQPGQPRRQQLIRQRM